MSKSVFESVDQYISDLFNDEDEALRKTEQAIKATRTAVENFKKTAKPELAALLEKLENELRTWQSKVSVILREPVGRQGMAKHAEHWIEQLKKGL